MQIIPASAGNTPLSVDPEGRCQDHPRIRGEHGHVVKLMLTPLGSSPHPRGTLGGEIGMLMSVRIIPASAGNTSGSRNPRGGKWDHPRIRGEHTDPRFSVTLFSGSSPHPRGTPHAGRRSKDRRRIIPASAGNTFPETQAPPGPQDHPRIRGEHNVRFPSGSLIQGSSPHPRGTPAHASQKISFAGIIPASAGNTKLGDERSKRQGDHPRIRGEHLLFPFLCPPCKGSSPHPRGTRSPAFWLFPSCRIIPASAGNTDRISLSLS